MMRTLEQEAKIERLCKLLTEARPHVVSACSDEEPEAQRYAPLLLAEIDDALRLKE